MVTIVLSNAQGQYLVNVAPGIMRSGPIRRVQDDPAKRSIQVDDGQTVNLILKCRRARSNGSADQVPGRDAAADPKSCTGSEGQRRAPAECFGCHGMSKWGMRTDHDGLGTRDWHDAASGSRGY